MNARRKLALLMAVAAVMMGVPVVANAQATADYTVRMGFGVPNGFSTRTLAPINHGTPTIHVAMGSVVDLFGGSAVLPQGTGPLQWHSDNTQELDSPYGIVLSDPDGDLVDPFQSDAPYKFNMALDSPSVAGCGGTADTPCSADGSSLLWGGNRFPGGPEDPEGHFFVRIDAQPGETLWATSPFGVSRLSVLKINVVATGVDTQTFIDDAAARIASRERDSALALHNKLSRGSTSHVVNGKRIWDAYAGYDSDTFALLDFYPKKLKIKKGDKVRWHFSSLNIEQHGLAFPLNAGKNISANGFLPVCDPDGDEADGPDVFVDFETFTCPDGHELEFDLARAMTGSSGDGRFPGGPQRVENSGLRGANMPVAPGFAGGTDPWDLKFTKVTGRKGYRYVCTFHGGGMKAAVVVK